MKLNRLLLVLGIFLAFVAEGTSQDDRERVTERTKMERELIQSRFEALDAHRTAASLPLLFDLLYLARLNQFGAASDPAEKRIAQQIATIPDHTKYLSEKLEKLSAPEPLDRTSRKREKILICLSLIPSRESLEKLGEVLNDDRNPDFEIAKSLPASELTFSMSSNSLLAANALGRILGDKSPVKKKPGFYSMEHVKDLREWWISPEGLAFRSSYPDAKPDSKPD